jgi:hypothetical protein
MQGSQHIHQPMITVRSHHMEALVLLMLIPIVAFLTLANLATYPTISGWDEGAYLQS